MSGVTKDMVLTFIDNTIKNYPECSGVLKAVRYRVQLMEELGEKRET